MSVVSRPLKSSLTCGLIILITQLFVLLVFTLCSCSGSRHVVKSETKYDSTSVSKLEIQQDSNVKQVKVSNTEVMVNNNIQSEDNYTEETIETTHYDTITGKPTQTITKTKRTGKKTETDLTKINTIQHAKDTISVNVQSNKKEEQKTAVSKSQKNKDAQSEFRFSFGKLALGLGVMLVFISGIFLIWKYIKHKSIL